MSIEKLDFDKVLQEKIGYTVILTEIIQYIKNSEAFMVWAYLFSHSANWTTIKAQLKVKFNIGNTKLKNIFSYLNRAGLIEYFQENQGKFGKLSIRVLCGNKFNKDEPFTVGSKTDPAGKSVDNSAGSITGRTGFRSTGPGPLRKERSLPKEKDLKKKDKSFYQKQNSEKHDFASMMNEAAHIKKSDAHKKAGAPPGLKVLVEELKARLKV